MEWGAELHGCKYKMETQIAEWEEEEEEGLTYIYGDCVTGLTLE